MGAAIATLGKNKISLTTQLEDTKRLADAESRDRASLLSKYKALSSDIFTLKQRIDEEAEKKNDILRSLSKAQSDVQLWSPNMRMMHCPELRNSRATELKSLQ